jgi:hypothetical protein
LQRNAASGAINGNGGYGRDESVDPPSPAPDVLKGNSDYRRDEDFDTSTFTEHDAIANRVIEYGCKKFMTESL